MVPQDVCRVLIVSENSSDQNDIADKLRACLQGNENHQITDAPLPPDDLQKRLVDCRIVCETVPNTSLASEKVESMCLENTPYSIIVVFAPSDQSGTAILETNHLLEVSTSSTAIYCCPGSLPDSNHEARPRLIVLPPPISKMVISQILCSIAAKHFACLALKRDNSELQLRLQENQEQLAREIELRTQVEQNLRSSRDSFQLKAETDAGTGLLNRGAILEQLQTIVQRAKVTHECYSLMFVDIDHFKSINDTHGHIAGDEILKSVAQRLASLLRPGDRLGRFGGEEFVVILPGCDINGAYVVGERLRSSIANHRFEFRNEQFSITISIGVVAPSEFQVASVNELLERADKAMYRAKELGRNRVETETLTPPYAQPFMPSMQTVSISIPAVGLDTK